MPRRDPYAEFQAPAKGQTDPYAEFAAPAQSKPRVVTPPVVKAPQQGFLSSAAESSGLTGLGQALGHTLLHPLDTAAAVVGGAKDSARNLRQAYDETYSNPTSAASHLASAIPVVGPMVRDSARNLKQAYNETYSNPASSASHLISAVPVLGSVLNRATDQYAEGNRAGELGTLAGFAGSVVAPELVARGVPAAARGLLTRGADEALPGSSLTPRMRYDAAKRMGVNLDLAAATNSPIPNIAKHANENSLLGSHVYEGAKARNLAALSKATDATLEGMSPLDREAGGARVQQLLKDNQSSLKNTSDGLYASVDQQFGGDRLQNPGAIRDGARAILKDNEQAYKEFPSLQPKQTTAILKDASNFGYHGQYPTVSDALKARSGMLDVYRTNPDIVKTAADAQLQKMVGTTHGAIMDQLPEAGQQSLRQAQETYADLKGTYDDPSSPYYHAIRNTSPSTLAEGVGAKTPEAVREFIKRTGEEGQGIAQRGAAEKLLGTAPGTEDYNFRSFPTQLSRLPAAYGQELFGNKLSPLRDISATAQALSKDLNPSGSGKLTQKIAEGALLPTGYPILQYPLAKAINSPALVDWAMRKPGLAAQVPPLRALAPLAAPRGNSSPALVPLGTLPAAASSAAPDVPDTPGPSTNPSRPQPPMQPEEAQMLLQHKIDPLTPEGKQRILEIRRKQRLRTGARYVSAPVGGGE